jgi:hypothetical protein
VIFVKHIYIIECRKHGVCKIGVSGDPIKRLKSIQTGYPWPLNIRTVLKSADAFGEESALHRQYQRWRLEGEWFDIAVAMDIEKRLGKTPIKLSDLCRVHRDEHEEFYCHHDFIDCLRLNIDGPTPPVGEYNWWAWIANELSIFAAEESGTRGTAKELLEQCFNAIPSYIDFNFKQLEAVAVQKAWGCSVPEYRRRIEERAWMTAPRDYCAIDDGIVQVPFQTDQTERGEHA